MPVSHLIEVPLSTARHVRVAEDRGFPNPEHPADCSPPAGTVNPDGGRPGAWDVFYESTQPAQEQKCLLTRFDCALILDGKYYDCALSPQPRAWPNESACDGLAPSSTGANLAPPLTVECEHCEDGIRWTSRYGGNDPDVWPVGRCETCDGTGQVELRCALCGEYGATDRVGDEVFHAGCAA
jgi:hypothetical protein